ncbi:MAG: hypothetical protein M3Q48_03010 [Actinomycetota bacterium]|nr:hypothetical protein [Actinomycetota bacterium]
MIHAYPHVASVAPGDDLVLHVSTDAAQFRVEFYRWGTGMAHRGTSEWCRGTPLPPHLSHQDWGRENVDLRGEVLGPWPGHRFPVPDTWEPGVYLALLSEGNGSGVISSPDAATPDGRHSRSLFVVRPASPGRRAPVLYKLPLLTYHAYNQGLAEAYDGGTRRGGWSFYTLPSPAQIGAGIPPCVSLHRPGGGTGGTPSDIWNFDPFDPTPRQTFVHWDAPFVAWLEGNGYEVDYCTDLDVHGEGGLDLLRRYPLLVSVGHDEYWSDAMRENVERFVGEGGNVAFFGGNTCWWRVTFDDPFTFRRVANWHEPGTPAGPENGLTGVSFRNGGERDLDDHPVPVGYRVQHAGHWVYEGTGVGDGDTFGDGPGEYLVGYECDGAEFDRGALARGRPATPTGDDGTPVGFTILGIGDIEPSGWGIGNAAATMGVYERNGTVFTAATTDWARLLAGQREPVVDAVTRNVLDRLGGRPR